MIYTHCFWRNSHYRLHWKLSLRYPPLQPVMKISSKWHLCFSVWLRYRSQLMHVISLPTSSMWSLASHYRSADVDQVPWRDMASLADVYHCFTHIKYVVPHQATTILADGLTVLGAQASVDTLIATRKDLICLLIPRITTWKTKQTNVTLHEKISTHKLS